MSNSDIDTVDSGVSALLPSELSKPDWDVIVAHCLGVDHVGHRFGPRSAVMGTKLDEMNALIGNVMRHPAIAEGKVSGDTSKFGEEKRSTLLIVLGDHGMTESGNHGGASAAETGTGVFFYSGTRKVTAPPGRLEPDMETLLSTEYVVHLLVSCFLASYPYFVYLAPHAHVYWCTLIGILVFDPSFGS